MYKGHWPLQTDCDRWWACSVETWVWLASKLINYFQMLNFALAFTRSTKVRKKLEKIQNLLKILQDREAGDKVRCAAQRHWHSLWTFGDADWFIWKSCDSLVWQGGAVETKPNGDSEVGIGRLGRGRDYVWLMSFNLPTPLCAVYTAEAEVEQMNYDQ